MDRKGEPQQEFKASYRLPANNQQLTAKCVSRKLGRRRREAKRDRAVQGNGVDAEWRLQLLHYGPCRKLKPGIRLVFGVDVAMWPCGHIVAATAK